MKPLIIILAIALLYGCSSKGVKQPADSLRKTSAPKTATIDSLAEFEKKIYLNIDEIKSGKVFTNSNKQDVFYRVLVIPQEENMMLIAENIKPGEEDGNYKLVKMLRITDDGSALPKLGLGTVDSLKFIDSVNIEGYFNHKKQIINLDKLKPWHVSY
jgi:hypothetical protein